MVYDENNMRCVNVFICLGHTVSFDDNGVPAVHRNVKKTCSQQASNSKPITNDNVLTSYATIFP